MSPDKCFKFCLYVTYKRQQITWKRGEHVLSTDMLFKGVDFTKSCKSKISRKYEFQPIKSLEITLTINLRLTIFCEIDPWYTELILYITVNLIQLHLF